MSRRRSASQAVPLILALSTAPHVQAADGDSTPAASAALPTIEVPAGTQPKPPARLATGRPGTVYEVDEDGMALYGSAGGTQPYSMVSGLPGVKAASLDPYGMTSRIGGNKGMRVRGVAAWHGANGTVDGLTLSNVNPGPGYLHLFDEEALGGVSLAQGPIAPDRPGIFNSAGSLDSEILWPKAQLGGQISASGGEYNFHRYALRADTGSMGEHDTRLAFVGSTAESDLWRGPGKSKRDNMLLAMSQQIGALDWRVLGVQSRLNQNNYRALTAAQAKDLKHYNNLGYDATPTSGSYQNYYDYNRQAFIDYAFIAEADYHFSADTVLGVKAFQFNESGSSFDGTATNRVRQWLIDHDSRGLSADLSTKLGEVGLKTGYALTSLEPPGPPTAQRMYTATASGLVWANATSSSTNQGWTTLSEVTHRHDIQTLYGMADRQWGQLKVTAGVRYFIERFPSLTEYQKAGVGELSTDDAIDASSGVRVSVEGQTVRKWLPWMEVRYAFTQEVEGRVAVGRNVGTPSFDLWNSNIKSLASSQQARAQALWNTLKPETDDAIDLGLTFNFPNGYLAPTLYYAAIHDKSVTVYDETLGLSYGQNIADGHLAGAELAWSWSPLNTVSLFGAASYSQAVFDDDLRTAASTTLAVKGKQFPDTPRWMANVGAQWQSQGWLAGGVLRYLGGRYDDSVHTNHFGGYTLLDLKAGHQWQLGRTTVKAEVSVLNALDKRYIAVIDVGDVQSGTIGYYPGAPRTALATLTIQY